MQEVSLCAAAERGGVRGRGVAVRLLRGLCGHDHNNAAAWCDPVEDTCDSHCCGQSEGAF